MEAFDLGLVCDPGLCGPGEADRDDYRWPAAPPQPDAALPGLKCQSFSSAPYYGGYLPRCSGSLASGDTVTGTNFGGAEPIDSQLGSDMAASMSHHAINSWNCQDTFQDSGGSGMTTGHSSVAEISNYPSSTDGKPIRLNLRIDEELVSEVNLTLTGRRSMESDSSSGTHAPVSPPHSPGGGSETLHLPTGKGAAKGKKHKTASSQIYSASLQIGSWKVVPRNQPDLVSKIYFYKRQIVWEVIEGGLKKKIEFQWSSISEMRVNFEGKDVDIWEITLSTIPSFHEESGSQRMKHTIWRKCPDFTGGQALDTRWTHRLVVAKAQKLRVEFEKLLMHADELRAMMNSSPGCLAPTQQEHQQLDHCGQPGMGAMGQALVPMQLKRQHHHVTYGDNGTQTPQTPRLFNLSDLSNMHNNGITDLSMAQAAGFYQGGSSSWGGVGQQMLLPHLPTASVPVQQQYPVPGWNQRYDQSVMLHNVTPQAAEPLEFSVGTEQLYQLKKMRPMQQQAEEEASLRMHLHMQQPQQVHQPQPQMPIQDPTMGQHTMAASQPMQQMPQQWPEFQHGDAMMPDTSMQDTMPPAFPSDFGRSEFWA